jgi:hypothetical protein
VDVLRGNVLVSTTDGRLVAFAATGCDASPCPPLWEGTLAGNATSAPVAGGDAVYVGMTDRKIAAFGLDGCGADTCSPLATVSPVWAGHLTGGPIVHDGTLIAGTDNGYVVGYRLPA